jgi:hypothetical protein
MIVGGLDVIVTVGAVPPEWHPLQPMDAMPFFRAWALADASRNARPAKSPSPNGCMKRDDTIGE